MQPTLPTTGAVLGIDVGYSTTRPSGAVCRLDWTREAVGWDIALFRAIEPERGEALKRLVDRPLLAAAFDGPLAPNFAGVHAHRAAERMLTRKIGGQIGKPGSSAAPVGKELNKAANECAKTVRGTGLVANASHPEKIDESAIIEAFPGAALGLMIDEPKTLKVKRGDRSDVFYKHLAEKGGLDRWIAHFLPGRRTAPFDKFADHDTEAALHDARAALVCALTALGLASDDYTAAGDDDGWIILPPRALMADWAWPLLEANAADGSGRLVDAAATRAS